MLIVVAADVPFPPDVVWSWWTDFGKVGEVVDVSHGFGPARRRVLEASPTHATLEEGGWLPGGRMLRFVRHELAIDPRAKRIEETAPTFRATWTFEPALRGTRILRVLEVGGVAGRLTPEAVARAVAQRDLDAHVADLVKELGKES